MSYELIQDKWRDEDMDDAAEWSEEEFLDSLGDRPVTLEELMEWLDSTEDGLNAEGMANVADLLVAVKKARGK